MSLKHVEGRVVVSVDIEGKNNWTFENGQTIRYERNWNNLNQREVQPVNATVISGDGLIAGSEILIHHNATIETNKINNYKSLSGEETGSDIKIYSIPIEQCFAWYNGNEWMPLKGFVFALRVFKPYIGILDSIESTKINDVLYITTGELNGYVVHTLKASDYEIVFQDKNGREGNIIRCRHFENEDHEREEVVAINQELTDKVNNGEYLVGLSHKDAKQITRKGKRKRIKGSKKILISQ